MEHAQEISSLCAHGPKASLVRALSVKNHLLVKRRPLMVFTFADVAPMPLHLTLGLTMALLHLAVEAVTFSHREDATLAFYTSMEEILKQESGVCPGPYLGGTLEGRECHRKGCKLLLLADLMDDNSPGPGAVAWRQACTHWQAPLPILNQCVTVSEENITRFATRAASFLVVLKKGFAWFSVSPNMHVLCCPAAAFLRHFGSLWRYSEQGLDTIHGRFNQASAKYTSRTLLCSCEAFVKASSVGVLPGSAAHNHFPK